MKKKLLFILILLGILIIGYNAVWLINLQKYIKLEHKVGYSEHYGTYAIEKDGYVFSVRRPRYLSFTGNLAVTKKRHYTQDVSEYEYTDLLVWPEFTGGYTTGVRICRETVVYAEERVMSDGNSIDLEFGKDGKLIPECAYMEEDYLAHKSEIDELIINCEEVWGIDLPSFE